MQRLQSAAELEALTTRAAHLIEAGRLGAARPLLSAARQLSPGSLRIADLSAALALRASTPAAAAQELDQAIAADPTHPGLRKRRAELRHQTADLDGATRDAAEAVVLAPADPAAKALLGALLLELGRAADAIACLREAVAAEPGNPGFAAGLAAAHEAAGDPDAALAVLLHNIAVAPNLVDQRNAAILLCVRRRDFRQAIRLAEDTSRAGIADACSFGLWGHALSSLGRHAEAIDAYAEALKLGPDDPYVRHLVAAAGVVPGTPRAPLEYLRAVFDGYAERFEPHLLSLGYRVPGLLRAALRRHPAIAGGTQFGPVLDLGCGTGLVALAISDLPVGPLVGVDVAARMLAQARAKQLYAELHEADIMEVLASDAASMRYAAILAGDVLCYFGALDDLFATACRCLVPGGWLVCSVEELLPDHDQMIPGDTGGAWALQRQGRYAHSAAYLRDAASGAGLQLIALEHETLRYEAEAPVHGMIAVMQRPVS